MRTDVNLSLKEASSVKETIKQLQENIQSTSTKIDDVSAAAAAATAKLNQIAAAAQQLEANLKKTQDQMQKMHETVDNITLLEKKFSTMEQTIQEALSKLEKKADISSLRAVAAKVGSISDEEEE